MTSRKIYEECGRRRKSYKVKDLILKAVVEKDSKKVLPGLDLLPSDPALIKAERWLTASNSPFTVLCETVDEVKDQYDYIIIDCAPNLYSLTKNCILASDYYVVPMIPDYLSTAGFHLLIEEIYDFSQDMIRTKPSPIQPKAVIFTKYRSVTRMHTETIPQVKAWLAAGFPAQGIAGGAVCAFTPPVADLIDNAYAQDENLPLCIYSPNCPASIQYRQLTDEFENLFSALP
jgi:cellulose biosynthesis protein BcsQ